MDCVYKIRNEHGMYSNGKVRYFRWTKKGVVFKSKLQLSAHLRAMVEADMLQIYQGCILLTFPLETPSEVSMDDMVEEMLLKKCIEILKG